MKTFTKFTSLLCAVVINAGLSTGAVATKTPQDFAQKINKLSQALVQENTTQAKEIFDFLEKNLNETIIIVKVGAYTYEEVRKKQTVQTSIQNVKNRIFDVVIKPIVRPFLQLLKTNKKALQDKNNTFIQNVITWYQTDIQDKLNNTKVYLKGYFKMS